ncbi:50S ribosomal protein L31e [Ignisphaera aggregans DSM 17230]|uniref:Large ribosomal subunit protein eL31 n=1 Tax=Ignisphaera aggregans (strain DSM 17230 / JCM 13409 / AQ1.S1) TaxID=583356 RepID=E0SQF8_IGNAA|nr:50S ribosomal protein L31e [Ignisphaera aggregans DSM 17230]
MPSSKSEGIYIIPLRRVYMAKGRRDRGKRAIRYIRKFLERHLGGRVLLDPYISSYVYQRKIEKPPRYIVVKFMRIDEGVYKAMLAFLVKR